MTTSTIDRKVVWGRFPERLPKKGLPMLISPTSSGRFPLGPVAAKLTRECFIDSRWDTINADVILDELPKEQPQAAACTISSVSVGANWTLDRGIATVLKLDVQHGVSWDLLLFAELLLERRHVVTLPQIEEQVVAAEHGGISGVSLDGSRRICFVRTGDSNYPVVACRFHQMEGVWPLRFYRLSDSTVFDAKTCILVPNFAD